VLTSLSWAKRLVLEHLTRTVVKKLPKRNVSLGEIARLDKSSKQLRGHPKAEFVLMDKSSAEVSAVSRFRWAVCALLFAATAINYMDRQVLGILVIPLQKGTWLV